MKELVTEIDQVGQVPENRTIAISKSLKIYSNRYEKLQIISKKIKTQSYKCSKRIFDIIIGAIGTIFLFPIIIIVKLVNLINGDKAPVLFRQSRIGKNGKIISIYKIRSMVPNAEKILEKLMQEDPKIKAEYKKNKKLAHDPRITKVGAFIRKTSLDEFGQFVNILKGEMTVVGPRPYLPREKEDMKEYYDSVIACKPGLTGLWQVEGRSNIGFENRCRLDKFYSEHKSMMFDIQIFFRTFASVLQSKGAR